MRASLISHLRSRVEEAGIATHQQTHEVLRVSRSKEDAKRNYNRLSSWYDLLVGSTEKTYSRAGVQKLQVAEGETILEIGFGTGHSILEFARSVGESGRVFGIDLSDRMVEISQSRVFEAGFAGRVELRCGDALDLPYADGTFDAVFISFTLELFDTPELEPLLRQCHRALKRRGRLCVVAMAKHGTPGTMTKLYEWAHIRFPRLVDCRPIYAERLLESAGFTIDDVAALSLWGLPVDIVLSRRERRPGFNRGSL